MSTFIQEVVRDLNDKNIGFSNIIFILPSKRAGAFLQKAISQELTTTIFSPTIYSIEDFVKHISGLKPITSLELLFKFYEVYLENTWIKEQESFQTFMAWAQTLLDDINEIDRHLLEPTSIFGYLKDIQELNHWTNTSPTDLIESYLSFWSKLPLYYSSLSHKLLSKNEGHQGLIYRKAAEDIEFYTQNNKKKHHVFLGFNALNTSEENIIQSVLSETNSSIYWDAEAHFMEFKNHDASYFLRKYRSKWKHFANNKLDWVFNNYIKEKEITCTAVPNNIDQSKYISNILKSYSKEQLNNTAIILGDENIIIPLINSLPSVVNEVNITMGIPLGSTPIASFFESLFELQLNITDNQQFYYKDVLEILNHPLSSLLFKSNSIESILQSITSNNLVYLEHSTILKKLSLDSAPLAQALYTPWNNNSKFSILSTNQIITYLLETLSPETNALLIEYLIAFRRVYNLLDKLTDSYSYIENINTLHRLYSDVVASETVDLRGNPYQGLQIMGVLESRLLDFENIIITSVNEGVLPSGKTSSSFLPYDLKIQYGLPTYAEKDAVYTYHFYRLLHRAKNINLLYTTTSSGLGSVEKSRLILQLESEGIHKIKQQVATPEILNLRSSSTSIIKTSSVQAKIKSFLQAGISPSAIGTYLRNPIDFYFQYILGVTSQNVVEETIASNTMGTIIHNVLERLYLPFINLNVVENDVKVMITKSKDLVDEEFKKIQNQTIEFGQNRIIYEVICRYLINFLKKELVSLQKGNLITITSLENKLKTTLQNNSLAYPITLKGTVDRVDIYNNEVRIIDYKTGAVKPADLKIKEWGDLRAADGKYEKAFQILLYTYMISKKEGVPDNVRAGIISTKKAQNGFMPFEINKETIISKETLHDFESILITLVQEIINPEIPFADSGFSY